MLEPRPFTLILCRNTGLQVHECGGNFACDNACDDYEQWVLPITEEQAERLLEQDV